MVTYRVLMDNVQIDFIRLEYEKHLDLTPGRFTVVIPLDTSITAPIESGVWHTIRIQRNGSDVFKGRVEKVRHDRINKLTYLEGRHEMCVLSKRLFFVTTSPPGVPGR